MVLCVPYDVSINTLVVSHHSREPDRWTENLVACYFKCLSFGGDYVEKQWNVSVVKKKIVLTGAESKEPKMYAL